MMLEVLPGHGNETDNSSSEQSVLCNGCMGDNVEKYCGQCAGALCLNCWETRPVHFLKNSSHKSTSYQEYKLFNMISFPRLSSAELEQQHDRDVLALWFSIDDASNTELGLQEYPRYADLVKEHQQQYSLNSCYSQIVSFIGSTGAGKSTLIRILMQQPWEVGAQATPQRSSMQLPISGCPDSTIPTSGDVHLYKVPMSDVLRPWKVLLYADCEGFRGGSRAVALASKDKVQMHHLTLGAASTFLANSYAFLKKGIKRKFNFTGGREEAVKELFPRVLYNFSDVVVHVMTHSAVREMESELTRLIEWAQNSQTTAINRVVLPHLIIVISKCPPTVPTWDPTATTNGILQEQFSSAGSNKIIQSYLKMFSQVEEGAVDTIGYLLGRCYSSIKILRIPTADNQYVFSGQLQVLDQTIKDAASKTECQKISSRCWITSSMQSKLFTMAFDHYREGLYKPFDFLESLYSLAPLEDRLVASFFGLLKRARKACTKEGVTAEQFRTALTPVICSTVALDCCRSVAKYPGRLKDKYKGRTVDLHQAGLGSNTAVTYQSQVAKAVDDFLDRACPCEYTDSSGNICVNSRLSHNNVSDHQNSSGKVFGNGTFESDFVDDLLLNWNNEIDKCLDDLDKELYDATTFSLTSPGQLECGDLLVTWAAHCKNLRRLYASLQALDTEDMDTCCWCLAGTPVQSLSCGHGICWSCAQMAGEPVVSVWNGSCTFQLDSCDLHQQRLTFVRPVYATRETN